MLGHLRSQRMTKLQIFMYWSLSAPTVGAVRGEDAVRSCFWSSDDPLFRHVHLGGFKRYDSLRLTGVSRTPTRWDVGSTRLQAVPGLPPALQQWRGVLHRLRDARRFQQ